MAGYRIVVEKSGWQEWFSRTFPDNKSVEAIEKVCVKYAQIKGYRFIRIEPIPNLPSRFDKAFYQRGHNMGCSGTKFSRDWAMGLRTPRG